METRTVRFVRVREQARIERLVREHWHLVAVTVRRCYPRLSDSDHEEVESAGYLALTRAAIGYDKTRGSSFQTHAISRIRYACHKAALLCAAGVFAHRRMEKWSDLALLPVCVPLESQSQYNDSRAGGQTFADLIACSSSDTEREVTEKEAARDLWQAVEETLPPKQRAIVRSYYIDGKTFCQIAGEIGLTQQRVGQIHGQAVNTLRRSLTVSEPPEGSGLD